MKKLVPSSYNKNISIRTYTKNEIIKYFEEKKMNIFKKAKDFFFSFLWLYLQHMEVFGPGVKLELQLWPVLQDSNTISGPHMQPTPQQGWILNPLSESRDGSYILTETMLGP